MLPECWLRRHAVYTHLADAGKVTRRVAAVCAVTAGGSIRFACRSRTCGAVRTAAFCAAGRRVPTIVRERFALAAVNDDLQQATKALKLGTRSRL